MPSPKSFIVNHADVKAPLATAQEAFARYEALSLVLADELDPSAAGARLKAEIANATTSEQRQDLVDRILRYEHSSAVEAQSAARKALYEMWGPVQVALIELLDAGQKVGSDLLQSALADEARLLSDWNLASQPMAISNAVKSLNTRLAEMRAGVTDWRQTGVLMPSTQNNSVLDWFANS